MRSRAGALSSAFSRSRRACVAREKAASRSGGSVGERVTASSKESRASPLLLVDARVGARALRTTPSREGKPAGLAVVAIAELKGDLALGRDPHPQTFPIAPFCERRALFPVIGLEPCVRQRHTHPRCVHSARGSAIRAVYVHVYVRKPAVTACLAMTALDHARKVSFLAQTT